MLLQYYPIQYKIPHTSTCHITTEGTINVGDHINVTSPIFSSIDFTSNQFYLSSGFDVVFKGTSSITSPIGGLDATLVCDDQDVFNMYVKS
jgi:hypothetical protein